MDDQQFCLKWNNHQSTLISVFDSMLQRNLLVDCTLAAEGRTVKAHKVVLSACSPYFENVLTDHFDKHPIVILKDVKYQELEAMMDYMYRGEVNVSQDQLGSLLKTAESLQIKGLSDSRKEDEPPKKREHPTITRDRTPDKQSAQSRIPLVETHDVETNNMSREGSQSPGPRKRKRLRRRPSQEDLDSKVLVLDNHDGTSNASSTLSNVNTTAVPTTSVPENDTSSRVSSISANASSKPVVRSSVPQVPVINESLEPHSEVMLEPKSEYVEDDTNDDNIEDLTVSLDDDDDDMDQSKPGPSHGDGSNQGFGSWHMDPSQDESFMSTQDPSGQRDAQDGQYVPISNAFFKKNFGSVVPLYQHFEFPCSKCHKSYTYLKNLNRHLKYECGKDPTFSCPYCTHKTFYKSSLQTHINRLHQNVLSINC